MPRESKEVKLKQDEEIRCQSDECPEMEKIDKIQRLLLSTTDQNSDFIIKLKQILNPKKTVIPGHREHNKDSTVQTDKIMGIEPKLFYGSRPRCKDNDDQLPIKEIATECQERKLVFDGYSDNELECLWVREYGEISELEWVNFKRLESVRQQQIKLLGSEQMYKRVNENLKNMKFEAHFAQEQSKLFHWRAKFFQKHFPLRDYDGRETWTCNAM